MSVFVPQIFISSYIKAYTNNINDLYKIIFKSYPHLSQLEFFLSAIVISTSNNVENKNVRLSFAKAVG